MKPLQQTTKPLFLYAEDDPDDAALLHDALASVNSDVVLLEAQNGMEVIAHLQTLTAQKESPSLIVLDINMPKLNGKETLEYIRSHKEYDAIPIVMLTTSSDTKEEAFCKKLGARWITKPATFLGLLHVAHFLVDLLSA